MTQLDEALQLLEEIAKPLPSTKNRDYHLSDCEVRLGQIQDSARTFLQKHREKGKIIPNKGIPISKVIEINNELSKLDPYEDAR